MDSENPNQLGYTMNGAIIYIAKAHELYKKLIDEEARMFRFGISVHETLHQVFTNFLYLEETVLKLENDGYFLNLFDKKMFCTIANLIEDPAIENMAPQVIGGVALKALDFLIEKLDELSGRFDSACHRPFEELINALVQFGDLGILHGTFQFKTAEKTFLKIAPLFYAAINEPDNKKRIDMVKPIHKICRPLWRQYSDRLQKEMDALLDNLLKRLNKTNPADSGTGSGRNGIENTDSLKNRKRKITIKKVSKEEYEKARQENNPQKDDGVSDIEILVCDETLPAEKGLKEAESPLEANSMGEKKSSSNKAELSNEKNPQSDNQPPDDLPCKHKGSPNTGSSPANTNDASMNTGVGQSDKNETPKLQEEREKENTFPPGPSSKTEESISAAEHVETAQQDRLELTEEEKAVLEQEDELSKLTEADFGSLLERLSRSYEEIKAEQEQVEQYYSDLPDCKEYFDALPIFNQASVLNSYIKDTDPRDEDFYDQVVKQMEEGIELMKTELSNIFIRDRGGRYYSDSGRVKLNRFASGKVTTRLFERKIRPSGKSDLCIALLNDNSSSTSNIINYIIATAIALAEIFAEFRIPLYCMSFQTGRGFDAKQTHYIRWENSRFERERLLHMKASGGNFDSYSIRYMTELLSQRPEKNKLMIVTSDGEPSHYFSGDSGIVQNTLAIEAARERKISVMGIGVGKNLALEKFYRMYQQDSFIHISKPNDLFVQLAEVITNIVNNF